jgi:hypothetical protein
MPEGEWELLLTSDDAAYGGSGYGLNVGDKVTSEVVTPAAVEGEPAETAAVAAADAPAARPFAMLDLPPLGVMVFKQVKTAKRARPKRKAKATAKTKTAKLKAAKTAKPKAVKPKAAKTAKPKAVKLKAAKTAKPKAVKPKAAKTAKPAK